MGNPGDTGWLILLYMLADDDEMYAAALADIAIPPIPSPGLMSHGYRG